MDEERDHVTVMEMEDLIRQLPAVEGCAVAINDWGSIEEIHVLTTAARGPKQIVRDVESALLARWGLRVDHKRISVAQLSEESQSQQGADRLTIAEYHVDLDTVQGMVTARVTLKIPGSEGQGYTGEWKGRYVPSQHYHAPAWAAIEAVNQVPGVSSPFVVADLKTISVAETTVVVVAVSRYSPRQREELLIGAASDRGEGQATSIRAVLDAVNRRISTPLPLR